MKVVVSHVYARSNAGDGLLADLSRDLVVEALGVNPQVICVDSRGFEDFEAALEIGGSGRSRMAALRGFLCSLGVGHQAAIEEIRSADVVVGVGGAYLRASRTSEVPGFAGVHLSQLRAAAQSDGAWVMLPQSIGPLIAPLDSMVARCLRGCDLLCLRDDRSMDHLASGGNARRVPDLAALDIGRRAQQGLVTPASPGSDGGLLIQLRPLPGVNAFAQACRDLLEAMESDWVLALQSTAGRLNDDRSLYAALGIETSLTVGQVLSKGPPVGAALCTRLHAALACIAAGVPALHVAYERKSYGVYADLGLSEFLVKPRDVGRIETVRRLHELRASPGPFWASLQQQAGSLHDGWRSLSSEIRRLAWR